MTKVIKRDGRSEAYSSTKISRAVCAAGGDLVLGTDIEFLVNLEAHRRDSITVDDLHYLVEHYLMRKEPETARRYIEYRSHRDRVRIAKSDLGKAIEELTAMTGDVVKENANKNAQLLSTQRDLIAGIVSKHFARNILPAHIMRAHDIGDIHYHDLDYNPFAPMTNCCLVDLKGMLQNGFRLGNAGLESPKSISVACAVMAQITAQVASHQYGGTTFANVDQVLAPYAQASWDKHWQIAADWNIPMPDDYADERVEKEIYDAFQGYEYEINTLFTTCGQSPFVTLTFGMGTSKFERMIQHAILRVRIKGIGKEGITPAFPKLVMFMEKGINLCKGDVNYDIKRLALECASKRMYPDIISAENNRKLTGSSVPVSPMGCRSFLSVWKDENGNEVLDGRNNLGVVSLNLPRIALESDEPKTFEGRYKKFMDILRERLFLCHEALEHRIKSLKGIKASVAPVLYMEGAFGKRLKADDDILDLFKGQRASISLGYIGLYEVGEILCKDETEEFKDDIRKEILMFIKNTVAEWKEQSEFGYSLYSTPAESLCYRFAKLDKTAFGSIKNITDKDYYTNSFHQDVRLKTNPIDKIDKEAPYHYIATGGHISYVEGPSVIHNLDALETIWDYAIEKLAYFGFNTPCDKCFECGSEKELSLQSGGPVCTCCGNNDPKRMNLIRRTCGYLGGGTGFNHGKTEEMKVRYKHVEV